LLAQLYFDSLGDKTSVKLLKIALTHFQKQKEGSSEDQRLRLLEEAYDETMERIKAQQPGYRQLALKVLSWIVLSKKPLTTRELQHALAVEVGESELDVDNFPHVEDMVSVCAGLVTVNEENNMILLVHDTTREYFEQPHTQEKWFPRGHAEITDACVAYLSLSGLSQDVQSHFDRIDSENYYDDRAYYWGESPPHNRPSENEYHWKIMNYFPLFFYAIENWGSHLGEAYRLGSPISASSIFWQFKGRKWQLFLKIPGHLRDRGFACDIYRAATAGYSHLLPVLEHWSEKADETKLNLLDCYGRTMLFYAVQAGHYDCVKFLLALDGIRVSESELECNDPLFSSIDQDLGEIFRMLLSKITVLEKQHNGNSQTIRQDNKDLLGYYSLERLRSLQIKASKDKKMDILKMLLDKTQAFDSPDGRAVLLLDADNWKGDKGSEFCVFLLERNLDIYAQDESKNTALHLAARASQYRTGIVKELLSRGVDAGALNSSGCTALQTAFDAHNFLVFLYLMKLSTTEMRENLKIDHELDTSSQHYGAKEVEKKIALLLRKDEGTLGRDSSGRTALSWAAEYPTGYTEFATDLISLVLAIEPGINSQDQSGRTALSHASRDQQEGYQRQVVVGALLDAGADPNIADIYGKTPLLHALERGGASYCSPSKVYLLLKAGADPNVRDNSGATPVGYLSKRRDFFTSRFTGSAAKIVDDLLRAGMDSNITDDSGKTPIFHILENQYNTTDGLLIAQEITWKLLEAGADITVKDSSERTPLLCSENADPSLLLILRTYECPKRGADVNNKDASGKTPLFYITESQIHYDVRAKMVMALLKAGVDPNIQDNLGRTPIFAAGESKDRSIWGILRNSGASVDVEDNLGKRPYLQIDYDY
jgi:ankyrin repeat protein